LSHAIKSGSPRRQHHLFLSFFYRAMMNRARECEEIITDTDTGKQYRMAGTFGFVRALSLSGRDPSLIFADLADGLLPPEEIKNVIKFSIVQVDGVDIEDGDRENSAIDLVESAGLQDASLLARMMMSHAMIGKIKKKHLDQNQAAQSIVKPLNNSRWKIFTLVGLSLAGSLAGLIALACMIFKY